MRRDDAKAAYRLEFSYTREIVDEMTRVAAWRMLRPYLWVIGVLIGLIAVAGALEIVRAPAPAEAAMVWLKTNAPLAAMLALFPFLVRWIMRRGGRRELRASPLMRSPVSISMSGAGLRFESSALQFWCAWRMVRQVAVSRNLIVLWVLGRGVFLPLPKALLDEDAETVAARIERWRAEPLEEDETTPG